jgi:hypothetical protein
LAGATAIEVNDAGITIRVVEPVTDPKVAVMVVAPAATLVARPELLMVAAPAVEEFQATELVMF